MMKKKLWIIIPAVVVLLGMLFVPIPSGTLDDGGTRVYSSLIYKIVDWNRIHPDGTFDETKVYFGADRWKTEDELFSEEEEKLEKVFRAVIVELSENSATVEPLAGEWERASADRISFGIQGFEAIGAEVGSVIEVTYQGGIMESYPAQIRATGWRMITPTPKNDDSEEEIVNPTENPTDLWLDKTTAKQVDNNIFSDIVITEIYENYFFARPAMPLPYTIKLNGVLSEEWCVGDQVICTYENTYYDEKNHRIECDVLTVNGSASRPQTNLLYKPVIYLYPEEETEVSVKLSCDGALLCTYPRYDSEIGGWTVTAHPDGTLTDGAGQTYNYLYWEGETGAQYDFSQGFCVRGEDTAAFLEVALEKLGLTRREANEFIVFWLPMMEKNPYNIISFQGLAYTEAARLEILPEPDTLIRVFMAWQASDVAVSLPEQQLSAPERTGFVAVEWGGSEVK